MHLTLKIEATHPAAPNALQQQARLDRDHHHVRADLLRRAGWRLRARQNLIDVEVTQGLRRLVRTVI